MTLHYDMVSLPVEMHYDLYIYSTLFTKNGSNKKKTKTLTNFTKFTRFKSQKLIICLHQLNTINRTFCCSLRRGRVYRAYCTGPSMRSLTWHIKLSPPVGECCPSVGVTPVATPDVAVSYHRWLATTAITIVHRSVQLNYTAIYSVLSLGYTTLFSIHN